MGDFDTAGSRLDQFVVDVDTACGYLNIDSSTRLLAVHIGIAGLSAGSVQCTLKRSAGNTSGFVKKKKKAKEVLKCVHRT